jgi:hypothetical protein
VTDELRRLLAEADAGPIRFDGFRLRPSSGRAIADMRYAHNLPNVALIVGAVNVLPGLLDVVDAARGVVDSEPEPVFWDNMDALRDALARLDGAS